MPPAKPDEVKPDAKPDEAKEGGLKIEPPAVTPAAPKEEAADKKADAAVKPALSALDLAEIEKLPAADKAMAMAQLTCPVTGENLGSMGVPLKVSAEGKTFLLCCKGCNQDVKDNPKEVVAKLLKK